MPYVDQRCTADKNVSHFLGTGICSQPKPLSLRQAGRISTTLPPSNTSIQPANSPTFSPVKSSPMEPGICLPVPMKSFSGNGEVISQEIGCHLPGSRKFISRNLSKRYPGHKLGFYKIFQTFLQYTGLIKNFPYYQIWHR